LAQCLNIPFLDSDQLIEQEEQATISQLFLEKGEDYFRSKEQELILNMDFDHPSVLATGGGLPCYNDLMSVLNKKGVTIYLKTSPETLYIRLLHDMEDRPLLEGMGEYELKMYIQDKLSEREGIYNMAQITLEEKDHNTDEIIRRLHLLQKN
jgi:shikimate kinase